MSDEIQRLQRAILYEYAVEVGLDPDAHYLGGASLRPLPPLDIHVGWLMILGRLPVGAVRDSRRD